MTAWRSTILGGSSPLFAGNNSPLSTQPFVNRVSARPFSGTHPGEEWLHAQQRFDRLGPSRELGPNFQFQFRVGQLNGDPRQLRREWRHSIIPSALKSRTCCGQRAVLLTSNQTQRSDHFLRLFTNSINDLISSSDNLSLNGGIFWVPRSSFFPSVTCFSISPSDVLL